MMKTIQTSIIGATLSLLTVIASFAVAEETDNAWNPLLAELGASNFKSRAAASEKLKQLTAAEFTVLAQQSHDQPSAEVVLRIQTEIDRRYSSEDPKDIAAASDVLESQVADERLLLADRAQQSLTLHWKKRIEIATRELEEHGAVVRHGSFRRLAGFGPFPGSAESNALRVLITEDWKGGSTGLKLFERLGALCGPQQRNGGIHVYLLSGHPLTDEEERRLLAVVGQNRVAKRSRVALGITSDPTAANGVLISQVSGGSSAEAAGLKAGDLIVAMEKKRAAKQSESDESDVLEIKPGSDKTLLRDFDDLVDRLMDYRVGDVMMAQVSRQPQIRRFIEPQPIDQEFPQQETETIEIKLKGWEDLIPE